MSTPTPPPEQPTAPRDDKAHFKARTLGVCYLLPHVRWYKVRRTHDGLSKPGLCSDCGERIVVRVLSSGGVLVEACACWRPLPRTE